MPNPSDRLGVTGKPPVAGPGALQYHSQVLSLNARCFFFLRKVYMINDIMVALEKSTKQVVVTLLSSVLFEMILFSSKTVESVDLSKNHLKYFSSKYL